MAFTSLVEKANDAVVSLQGDAELVDPDNSLYVDVEWAIGEVDTNWLVGSVKA
jgi:hypothetical protein